MLQNPELKKQINLLPKRPGVYLFFDQNKHILYVGKAISLKDRVQSYLQKNLLPKTEQLVSLIFGIEHIETGSEFSALLLEANLIKKHLPKFNSILRDDKSYLYIFVSLGEEFPKVFTARKPKSKINQLLKSKWEIFQNFKGKYFGPFPSSKNTYQIIKWLRKIIPFCQQKNIGKKACFYNHLNLCNPCPSNIVKQNPAEFKIQKKIYRKNIFRLTKILSGKFSGVEKSLLKEIALLSKNQDFEQAVIFRNRLNYLNYLLIKQNVASFLSNPDFLQTTTINTSNQLLKILKQEKININKLEKIEAYDISNINGQLAVGSQVVFVNGLAEKNLYRKYKIKNVKQISDVLMLAEIIKRRFSHKNWDFPNLIIVDGGKPQVGEINKLLKKMQINIPVIGLAKKQELIVIQKQQFSEIRITKNNSALQLLQQIRDEAHRFAISYHRNLRRKFLTSNG